MLHVLPVYQECIRDVSFRLSLNGLSCIIDVLEGVPHTSVCPTIIGDVFDLFISVYWSCIDNAIHPNTS